MTRSYTPLEVALDKRDLEMFKILLSVAKEKDLLGFQNFCIIYDREQLDYFKLAMEKGNNKVEPFIIKQSVAFNAVSIFRLLLDTPTIKVDLKVKMNLIAFI